MRAQTLSDLQQIFRDLFCELKKKFATLLQMFRKEIQPFKRTSTILKLLKGLNLNMQFSNPPIDQII